MQNVGGSGTKVKYGSTKYVAQKNNTHTHLIYTDIWMCTADGIKI